MITGDQARRRLRDNWETFVEPNLDAAASGNSLGCRHGNLELIMSCVVAGKREQAIALYEAIQRFQLDDGGWWTGYVFPDDIHWPDEKPTDSWRGAACR